MNALIPVLVCGGAGYIGSHMCKMLAANGYHPVTFDNLSTGYRWAVKWGDFVEGDLRDKQALRELFARYRFAAVMHFSARSLVGESMQRPEIYYENNVSGTLNLLDAMVQNEIRRFVFSSTAAIFGNPEAEQIAETHPRRPINPYGRSKLMVESILGDFHAAHSIDVVSLRYFNAAGADPDAEIGEAHEPETHLIPNVLKSLLGGSPLTVFGDDYETADGTCVRDYIHIEDLCRAHLLALGYLQQESGCSAFNLGNGNGFSVLEIIRASEVVAGRPIDYQIQPRREGDPPRLVADNTLAKEVLGWEPEHTHVEEIIETAWRWHQHKG